MSNTKQAVRDRLPKTWVAWLFLKLRWLKLAYLRLRGRTVVHVLHIGKTGGTAVKEALASDRITASHVIQLHDHDFKLDDVPEGEKVVFFVRDPVARFVSGFNTRKREGRPRYYTPWTVEEAKAFERFSSPNQLALGLTSQVPEEREAATRAMNTMIHVSWVFEKWLVSQELLITRLSDVLLIGFQESLGDDFVFLKKLLGVEESVELPSDDAKAHRSPSGSDTHLEEKARKNLVEWYAADYEFFDLCRKHAADVRQASLAK